MLTVDNVKNQLNLIGYQKPFKVIFTKADGTQREMTCMMQPPVGTTKGHPDVVPVMEISTGQWKSFNVTKVLHLEVT